MINHSDSRSDALDAVALPADFTVWLAGKEADIVKGRFVAS